MTLKEKIESFFRNRFVRYSFTIPFAFYISNHLLHYHDLPMRNVIAVNNYKRLIEDSAENNKKLKWQLTDIFIADSTFMKLEPEELEKLSAIFIMDGKYYLAERTGYIAEARYAQRDSIYMDNSLLADTEFRNRINRYLKWFMINKSFKKIISIIVRKLNKNKIKYALIGSSNLALQGIKINPRDLDFVVTLKDLKIITRIFSGYTISHLKKLKSFTNEPAWEVILKINNIEIHFMGENNTGEYVSKLLKNKITYIDIDNIKVKCFTLEAEAQAYEETNRGDRANMIREFLKKNA